MDMTQAVVAPWWSFRGSAAIQPGEEAEDEETKKESPLLAAPQEVLCEPTTLRAARLSYTVRGKAILSDVSAVFEPCKVKAVMGPSVRLVSTSRANFIKSCRARARRPF